MSIRDKLLRLLIGARGTVFSGETLASKLRVSRTAVWKQIHSLQSIGYPIESQGRDGYRLVGAAEPSLLEFRGSPGWTPHYYLNTASTQLLAKAGAASGLPEGHLWIAETQAKGRGRLERRWESSYGGLWFSILLRPSLPPARMAALTLVAGLALRSAVHRLTGIKAVLKWPNDLMVSGPKGSFRKVAGILTEMSGQMDRTEWMVLGVGLNVNNRLPPELSSLAVSVSDLTGQVEERGRLLRGFLEDFQQAYPIFLKKGFGPFRRTYWTHYYAPEQPVRLSTSSGPVTGRAAGVDAKGALMIESRRKMNVFSEGEIVL